MSTVKTTNLQHASAGSPAIVLDAAGDATYAGTHDFSAATVTGVGKVLQVVRATDTTSRVTSSASFVDVTGMTVTITPQKSTSAILIMSLFLGWANGSNPVGEFAITDSSNNLISGAENGQLSGVLSDLRVSVCLVGYATPATTSATTYKLRFRQGASTSTTIRNDLQTGQIYAIEVAA